MAKKSKTQRAKASAARAERKAQAKIAAEQGAEAKEASSNAEAPKKGLLKKSETAAPSSSTKTAKAVKEEKKDKKPGKIKTFYKGVKSELRRVTWPSRQDVVRWSGVVVAALAFFGISVAVLDNFVVTPLLVAISSLAGVIA